VPAGAARPRPLPARARTARSCFLCAPKPSRWLPTVPRGPTGCASWPPSGSRSTPAQPNCLNSKLPAVRPCAPAFRRVSP